jgi:TonB family protein
MINKILIYIWLTGLFIFPAFGQEFGSAVINSIPDSADVYINDYHFGKTPFQPVKVIPGIYKLKLKHKGYDSLLTEMNIESGKRLVGKIALKAKNDSVNADSIAEVLQRIPRCDEFVEINLPPHMKDKKNPCCPRLAKEKGLGGKVYLQLLIDLDGTIMDVVVAKSSGAFCLDYEALTTAYNITFSPAHGQDNKPARVWVMWPVAF